MQPDTVGHSREAAAVVSALFFLFAILTVTNLLLSKFKLFAILAFGSVLRGIAYACSAAYLVHPRRELYIIFQTLESVGYGASIVVLFLALAMWLKVQKEQRPPHPRVIAWLCHILPALTGVLALVVAPIAFTKTYQIDDQSANQLGKRLSLATFWGRAGILAIFACMNIVLSVFACKSYRADKKVQDAENAVNFLAVKSPKGARKWIHHDTRLLVNIVLLSTLLQCIPCAIQVASLYYMWLKRDVYYMPLVILPQFLEALFLNIPGLLPRLAQPYDGQNVLSCRGGTHGSSSSDDEP